MAGHDKRLTWTGAMIVQHTTALLSGAKGVLAAEADLTALPEQGDQHRSRLRLATTYIGLPGAVGSSSETGSTVGGTHVAVAGLAELIEQVLLFFGLETA